MKILIATRNLHKVEEIRAILGTGFECLSLRDYQDAPEVVEDAPTFEGNARKKAESLAQWLMERQNAEYGTRNREAGSENEIQYVLADDSGLEVDALDGAPGVYSARFAALDSEAGGNAGDTDNNAKLLRLLDDVPEEKRTARFRCVLALVPVKPQSAIVNPQCFEGTCEGSIGFAPQGRGGFGYDPLFFSTDSAQSFAELPPARKNEISHRSRALAKLSEFMRSVGFQPEQLDGIRGGNNLTQE